MTRQTFRPGPLGALMDEYERAAEDLKKVLNTIAPEDYTAIVDPETKDPDCVSMQTIMNHVVRSGYGYANYLRKEFGDAWTERKESYEVNTPASASAALDLMLAYSVATLQDKWHLTYDDLEHRIIKSSWGQQFDPEQLLEHAIVHILRHRRQIEKFIIKRQTGAFPPATS